MSNPESFPWYIQRTEEQHRILAEAALVRVHGQSRAVILYGRGGTGKTRLVRQLPKINQDLKVIWLDPIAVDDSQHWLLSNLEQHIAGQLDPERQYFGPYFGYLSELPRRRLTPTSREMVLDHLNRIKDVFTQCYKRYIDETENTVVITFDTIEAIRGMHLQRTLTRWMKALPKTLFILAGRSLADADIKQDPIKIALEEPPQRMVVTDIELGQFSAGDSRKYLATISQEAGLSEAQTERLVHLTQGHPLWLALTVDYLTGEGLPEELGASLEQIKEELPYHGEPTAAGRDRAESFKGHLVAPYQGTDFWHEAIKRLAVVRESVSQPIWLELMADRPWPADMANPDQAWEELQATEWIRPRANRRYVTLHDTVAEELAQRVIGLHDPDQRQRQKLWRRATDIYATRAAELQSHLDEQQPGVDSRLEAWNAAQEPGSGLETVKADAALIRDVAALDREQQELNQVRAARLFYQLLSDFQVGADRFVALLREAMEKHDVLFEDLLAFQMQRFLPGQADASALGDTVGTAIDAFREWLASDDGRFSHVDIGLEMASYLLDREQADAAIGVLDRLPIPLDHQRRYRLYNLQGNACMRISGRVAEAEARFQEALEEARQVLTPGQYREIADAYIADAYKELGFYYRNIGLWVKADDAYRQARDTILQSPWQGTRAARTEMASIHNNWAYVKGIGGRYDDGINLVESAIAVRRMIGRRHEQAISYSVKGEVCRYQRQFKDAWEAYAEAEQLLREQSSPSWLGVIYQEQAICLFQSIPAGVQLLPAQQDPAKQAESLIDHSVKLCRVFNARYLPSALNRAGRIFGPKDPDLGLAYLLEAAEKAQGLSDGWFWLASLIEYAELCYRTWAEGAKPSYLDKIPAIATRLFDPELDEVQFPELRGRWNVLQGHLEIHMGLAGDTSRFDIALENYRVGFPLIASGWVGSYGASAILGEFRKFSGLFWQLASETRQHWRLELRRSWGGLEASSAQLLARLEELY